MKDSAKIVIISCHTMYVSGTWATADIVIDCSNGIYKIVKDRYSDRNGNIITQEELDTMIIVEGI